MRVRRRVWILGVYVCGLAVATVAGLTQPPMSGVSRAAALPSSPAIAVPVSSSLGGLAALLAGCHALAIARRLLRT